MMKKSDIFNFKKFAVSHSVNAQKISTDSVLLGAWTDFSGAKSILDIGTGCGILSLMAAQKTNSLVSIDAVEIDKKFAEEADLNFKASQWPLKINLTVTDIKNFDRRGFDHIIANPPYFSEKIYSPLSEKNRARHDLDLTFEELAYIAKQKLTGDGIISLVGPAQIQERILNAFRNESFHLKRICKVKHYERAEPSLLLFEFGLKELIPLNEELIIRNEDGSYSAQYSLLLGDFLIIF